MKELGDRFFRDYVTFEKWLFRALTCSAIGICFVIAVPQGHAVILYSTGDASYNVIESQADHALAKYVGNYGGFSGTQTFGLGGIATNFGTSKRRY